MPLVTNNSQPVIAKKKVSEKGTRRSLYTVLAFINVGAIFRHDLEAIGHDGAMAPKVLM
jgi:hypothetical protein